MPWANNKCNSTEKEEKDVSFHISFSVKIRKDSKFASQIDFFLDSLITNTIKCPNKTPCWFFFAESKRMALIQGPAEVIDLCEWKKTGDASDGKSSWVSPWERCQMGVLTIYFGHLDPDIWMYCICCVCLICAKVEWFNVQFCCWVPSKLLQALTIPGLGHSTHWRTAKTDSVHMFEWRVGEWSRCNWNKLMCQKMNQR